jgi:protein-disulfide isomerase
MSKQFWGVIAVIVLIFAGIAIVSGNKSDSDSKGKSGSSSVSQHVKGSGTSGVTLIEYGDYECPFCGQYYPTIKQVQAEFGDQIKFQFRNFPLINIHQNAFAAARAAEAASLQNKFWEMHDLLYENQSAWSSASAPSTFFDQYAQQIGLNMTQYKTDYASSKVNDTINADMAAGNKLDITGTPTFFIDGKQVQINNTTADFEKVIKAAIAKKGPTSSGTTSQTPTSSSSSDSSGSSSGQ